MRLSQLTLSLVRNARSLGWPDATLASAARPPCLRAGPEKEMKNTLEGNQTISILFDSEAFLHRPFYRGASRRPKESSTGPSIVGLTGIWPAPIAGRGQAVRSTIMDNQKESSRSSRRMVWAEIDGKHTHETATGVKVHIWERDGKCIARGRHNGRQFGEALGWDPKEAASALRRLLTQIEDRTYLVPSDPVRKLRDKRKQTSVKRITIDDLSDRYIADVLRKRGNETAKRYKDWLEHVRAYLAQPEVAKKTKLAIDATEEMVLDLKTFLCTRKVPRNGHANSPKQPMSPKGVRDVLETLARVFTFGQKEGLLPAEFRNPVTPEIIGPKPKVDPIRPIPYPLKDRIAMVRHADKFQLSHVVPRFVLPVRPAELAGLLIPEMDIEDRVLRLRTRFKGRDWTKSKTSFSVPFPCELLPLIVAAVAGRTDGPVFRARRFFDGSKKPKTRIADSGDMDTIVERTLAKAASSIDGPADTKPIVRKALVRAGGITTDELAREFKKLRRAAGVESSESSYKLRSSVLTDMTASGVSKIVQEYLAGHALRGTLDEYYIVRTLEDIATQMERYWEYARDLLDAIQERAVQLGLSDLEGGDTYA